MEGDVGLVAVYAEVGGFKNTVLLFGVQGLGTAQAPSVFDVGGVHMAIMFANVGSLQGETYRKEKCCTSSATPVYLCTSK